MRLTLTFLALSLAVAQEEPVELPDHPHLTARFRFIKHLTRRQSSKSARQRRLMQLPALPGLTETLPMLPPELRPRFGGAKSLGAGSFGRTFLAEDKEHEGRLVAVKVLKTGMPPVETYITPKICQGNKEIMELVKASEDECRKISKIHEADGVDKEGGARVIQCLEDGVTPAMMDPTSMQPLYIVLSYAGQDLERYWEGLLEMPQADVLTTSGKLRTITRNMLEGLRFMTNKDRALKWVHHDLKPGNMAADDSGASLIDLGTAIPSDRPDETAVCTLVFRPPEFLKLQNEVGWSAPVHSFDVASAAYSVFAMGLATPGMFPHFVDYSVQMASLEHLKLNTYALLGDCVAQEDRSGGADFERWFQAWLLCWQQQGMDSDINKVLNKAMEPWRQAKSSNERVQALANLASCTSLPGIYFTSEKVTAQVLAEWVDTDFDRALLKMLDFDPAQRPHPEDLLKEKWLALDYQPSTSDVTSVKHSVRSARCPEPLLAAQASVMKFHVLVPGVLIALTWAAACLCCCVGGCCHFCFRAPSSAFSGLVLATAALGSCVCGLLWFSESRAAFLLLLGALLAPALAVTGCLAAQRPGLEEPVRKAWSALLSGSGAFFLLALIGTRWVAGPSLKLIGNMELQWPDFWDANQAAGVLVPLAKEHLMALRLFMLGTMLPSLVGLVAVGFALWREDVHKRAAGLASVSGREVGMELRDTSSTASNA